MRRAARTAFMSPAERGTSALVSRMLQIMTLKFVSMASSVGDATWGGGEPPTAEP